MFIRSVSIKNWMSFDGEGVEVEGLKKINLFIGPNNSGKSNLFRYFVFLKKTLLASSNEKPKLGVMSTWQWNRKPVLCEIGFILNNKNIYSQIFYKTDKSYLQKIAESSFLFLKHNCNNIVNVNYLFGDYFFVREKEYSFNIREVLDDPINGKYSDIAHGADDSRINKYGSHISSEFKEGFVFVDPVRHYRRSEKVKENASSDYYFDGSNTMRQLYEMARDNSNPDVWIKFKSKVVEWLSSIVNEKIVSIVPYEDDLKVEFLSLEGYNLEFSLENIGTGVSQAIMLLSYLYLNQEKKLVVFLEEPECNLHPGSVIKMIKIIESEMPNHQLFITTHSPSLIDCIHDDWSVYYFSKKENGASSVIKKENRHQSYSMLDNLGVLPSQIFQANTVIWVEGPSDRIYIKKWFDEFSNGELIEGKDYSFLFFGGSNISSFSISQEIFDDEINGFIDMLCLSRKCLVITDSDCADIDQYENEEWKTYLNKFEDRVNQSYKDIGGCSENNSFFKLWVTGCREIENYVDKELLFETLKLDGIRRKEYEKDKKKIKISIAGDSSDFNFEQFSSYDKAIVPMYSAEDDKAIPNDKLKTISTHYSGKKVAIAKEVVKDWNKADHGNVYDLEAKMEEIVSFIKS